jgi:hypothetical protein
LPGRITLRLMVLSSGAEMIISLPTALSARASSLFALASIVWRVSTSPLAL